MIIEQIIYCADYPALEAELLSKFPEYVDVEQTKRADRILCDKTPPKWNGDSFVCVIRIRVDLLGNLTTIEALGTYSEGLVEGGQDKIDLVYDSSEMMYVSEEGEQHTYTPPTQIGAFL